MNRTLSVALSGALFALLSVSSLAASEGGANHGGTAVVCRDDQEKITSAELLDLYEMTNLGARPLLDRATPDYAGVRDAVRAKLAAFPAYAGYLESALATLAPLYRALPEGTALELTSDVFPIVKQAGCAIEQLAVFRDGEQPDQPKEIVLDPAIYAALAPLDRVALVLHEAAYWLDRRWAGATDSRYARSLVGELLAQDTDAKEIDRILVRYDALGPRPGRYLFRADDPRIPPCIVRLRFEVDGLPRLAKAGGQCGYVGDLLERPVEIVFQPVLGSPAEWIWKRDPKAPRSGSDYMTLAHSSVGHLIVNSLAFDYWAE